MKIHGEEHDVQSYIFRPTITDVQDEYCGECYDIRSIQNQNQGNHKRGGRRQPPLNRVNIVAVTTALALHVGV